MAGSDTVAGLSGAGVTYWGNCDGGKCDGVGPYVQLSASGEHMCAVTALGGLECWGEDSGGETVPPDGVGFLQVSIGAAHACAVTTLGEIECWGGDLYGETVVPR